MKFQPRHAAGFSLLELLIVVALMLVLTAIYFGPNSASKQHAVKVACQGNLTKIYIALQIYAKDYQDRFPQMKDAHHSAQALGMLAPKYTSDTSPFTCPGSHDSSLPSGESFASRRISYAYYMGRTVTNTEPLLTDWQVNTKAKVRGEPVFSNDGKAPGNNHGKYGGNLLYCDGNVQMWPAVAQTELTLTNGETLLNP